MISPVQVLLDTFNANSLGYAVLRNFDEVLLPQYPGDVDVCVTSEDFSRVKACLSSLEWLERREPATTSGQYWFYYLDEYGGHIYCLNIYTEVPFIELNSGCDVNDIIKRRVLLGTNFYIPDPQDVACLYFFHLLLKDNVNIPIYGDKIFSYSERGLVDLKCKFGMLLKKMFHKEPLAPEFYGFKATSDKKTTLQNQAMKKSYKLAYVTDCDSFNLNEIFREKVTLKFSYYDFTAKMNALVFFRKLIALIFNRRSLTIAKIPCLRGRLWQKIYLLFDGLIVFDEQTVIDRCKNIKCRWVLSLNSRTFDRDGWKKLMTTLIKDSVFVRKIFISSKGVD